MDVSPAPTAATEIAIVEQELVVVRITLPSQQGHPLAARKAPVTICRFNCRMRKEEFVTRILMFTGVVAFALSLAPPASAAPPARIAIIVPGQGEGPDTYRLLAQTLEVQGYQAQVLNLAGRDLVADAHAIAATVDTARARQPGSPLSLIGHSVGGLSARYYLKALGGSNHISNYVAIGTPQYGVAPQCPGNTARDTCFQSNFLQTLNDGTDTPGPTNYYAIRGEREYSDGRLDGGQCRLAAIPGVPGLNGRFDHGAEPYNPLVWSAVSSALTGGCPGAYITDPEYALTPESTTRSSFPN